MCHAAIVCREYGLPTVVGTGRGTSFIKTGDVIRIDGDEGSVTRREPSRLTLAGGGPHGVPPGDLPPFRGNPLPAEYGCVYPTRSGDRHV